MRRRSEGHGAGRKVLYSGEGANNTPTHLAALEEIERECILGLVEVLGTEDIEGVRYALWDMTSWHVKYDPCIWRGRATGEQRREGWQMWVRMEKILVTVPAEAHKRQIEETMNVLEEEADGFYQ